MNEMPMVTKTSGTIGRCFVAIVLRSWLCRCHFKSHCRRDNATFERLHEECTRYAVKQVVEAVSAKDLAQFVVVKWRSFYVHGFEVAISSKITRKR